MTTDTLNWHHISQDLSFGFTPNPKLPSFIIQRAVTKRLFRKPVEKFFIKKCVLGVLGEIRFEELGELMWRSTAMKVAAVGLHAHKIETLLRPAGKCSYPTLQDFESGGVYTVGLGQPYWDNLRKCHYGHSADWVKDRFIELSRKHGKTFASDSKPFASGGIITPKNFYKGPLGKSYEDMLSDGFGGRPRKIFVIEMQPRRAKEDCWVSAAGMSTGIVLPAYHSERGEWKVPKAYKNWPSARKYSRMLSKKYPKFKFRIVSPTKSGEGKMWNNPNRGLRKVFLIQCVTNKPQTVCLLGTLHALAVGTNRIDTVYPTYEAARDEAKRVGKLHPSVVFRVVHEWREKPKPAKPVDFTMAVVTLDKAKLEAVAGAMRSTAKDESCPEYIAAIVLEGIAQACEIKREEKSGGS